MIPTIQDEAQAEAMLRHYMREQWHDEHLGVVPDLIHQPGAFVREVALHARMLAAHDHRIDVTLDMLESSVQSLLRQMRAESDFLTQRRPIGLVNANNKKNNNRTPFGWTRL